jgi:hypothetical protein
MPLSTEGVKLCIEATFDRRRLRDVATRGVRHGRAGLRLKGGGVDAHFYSSGGPEMRGSGSILAMSLNRFWKT